MLTIHYREEQNFITELLKSQNISNDVWIGVKYVNNKYKWNDGTDVVYQNWAQGSPKHKDDRCAQFDLSDDMLTGKWTDVMCGKMNMVVCQKLQELQDWTFDQMKSMLIKVMKNPDPIGFTYVQFPYEKEPGVIWPFE